MSLQIVIMSLRCQNNVITDMRQEYFQIRVTEAEKQEITEVAIDLGISASQFFREAARDKIKRLKQEAAEFEAAMQPAEVATVG